MHSEDTLMMDPLQKEPQSGDLVQGYLLGQLLGRGANGSVYLATKPGEPLSYAIKIIDTQGHPRAFIDRLLRECSISTRLHHPGIVHVHEAGYWGACIFIVMDVAVGRSCDQYQGGALGWELSLEVVRQVARALDHAYVSNHVIHRDIKPANIVVDLIGGSLRSVKVVDFGLSRSVDEEGDALTMTGMVLGTPYYMSPEQARGDRDLTFHTDLYALGATLFFLIAGRPPFADGTAVEVLLRHCNEPPPRLIDVAPSCPAAISELVARCLAKDPSERFASYAELIAEIDRHLGEHPFASSDSGGSSMQPSTRYSHRTVRDASSSARTAVPNKDGSTSSGSNALGDLLRAKLQETTRSYRKRADTEVPPARLLRVQGAASPTPTPKPPAPKRPPSLAAGTLVDSAYSVGEPIGVGAMGEVYAVEDRFTGRELAIKILSDEDMRRPGAIRRFKGECSALATVEHPAFPFFAGKGVYQDRDYLLMERVKGVDLKTWLQLNNGKMGEAGALTVVLQLAEAMDRAYAKCGMVHRDIKPANLMFTLVDGTQQVRIVDFGVSTYIDYGDFEDFSAREYRYIDDDSQGKAVGTPAYMSPEQCVGAPPSPLMDIYSIGCTFFCLITGRPPYQAPTAAAMMMKHIQDPPPSFDGLVEVSSGSAYLLKRCMAKNPRDRFHNYNQIIAAVNSASFSLSTRIRRNVNVPVNVPPTTSTWRRPGM